MRINTIQVRGYRSLAHVAWSPGDLNVLIGPNAVGKSNVLRAIELVPAAAEGKLADRVQSEGGFNSLLWDGQVDCLEILLGMIEPEGKDQPAFRATYEIRVEGMGRSAGYKVRREALIWDFYERYPEPQIVLERDRQRGSIHDSKLGKLVAVDELLPDEETLLSVSAGPLGSNKLSYAFQREVASWRVYHRLDTSSDSAIRQAAIARRDGIVSRNGQNLIPVLHTLYSEHREFKSELNQAMTAAFGDEFEELVFAPAADQRIQMRIRWRSLRREQSAADLSDGTLRFLFLLAVLGNPDPPPLIAIDEPETGLHPSMLPIVAEFAVAASKKTQVIFTTHSPSFLDAFRDETPTTTVAEWKDGKTSLHVRSGDDLAYWLKEYSLGELYRTGELETVE